MRVYEKPLYYDIAFSFVNAKNQVDFFEKLARKYSSLRPKVFLDVACGTSPQLMELAKRGYECVGLDSSPEMIRFLQKRAKKENAKIRTIRGDMITFKLKKKADFAFIMLGSIVYTKNKKGFLSHLDSVANSLNKGGLYVIENFRLNIKSLLKEQNWTIKKGKIAIKTVYKVYPKEGSKLKEIMTLKVNDHGHQMQFSETSNTQYISMKEFKDLIKSNDKFELLGVFEHFKFKKLNKQKNLNLIVLRRI